MKKTLFILCVIPLLSFPQTAFNDAVELSKLNPTIHNGKLIFPVINGNNTAASEILIKYTGGSNYNQVQAALTSNAFIGLPSVTSASASATIPSNSKFLGSIGGLNVTNIADGLAKFLVERTKQELSITFFQNFKKVLQDDNNKDFKALFPNTFEVLIAVDNEIYLFSNYLNTFREAFQKDLEVILINLEPLLSKKKDDYYKNDKNLKTAKNIEFFESGLILVNNLRNGIHPAEAIGKLKNQKVNTKNSELIKIHNGVKLFDILSKSLRSENADHYWVESQDIKKLLDLNTLKIYLGLLYQLHGDEILFGNSFKTYLDPIVGNINKINTWKNFISDLVVAGEQVDLVINSIRKKKGKGEKIDSYIELFRSTSKFLQSLAKINSIDGFLFNANELKILEEVSNVFQISSDVYIDINEGKYNALIIDVAKLLNELLADGSFKWKDDFIKYGTFVANVAQADNSEEVKSAIEAIALPAGSATIKKRSNFNISLNAYLGLTGGREYNGDTEKTKWFGAIHAPVGIAFSLGLRSKKNELGSISLFTSLIDIGAVTNFRFSDNETEELPDIKLENIFAPGGYLVYGFPKIPISLGAGFQFGPQLREVTSMNLSLSPNPSYSFGAFIAVDIPLLNFYTKSR